MSEIFKAWPKCGDDSLGYRSILILRDERGGSWGESCEGFGLSVARTESETVECRACGTRVDRLKATGRSRRVVGNLV